MKLSQRLKLKKAVWQVGGEGHQIYTEKTNWLTRNGQEKLDTGETGEERANSWKGRKSKRDKNMRDQGVQNKTGNHLNKNPEPCLNLKIPVV